MSTSRYHSAFALGGVEGVLFELVDEMQNFAARQHPAVCNRSLYEFAATLKYKAQSMETLKNCENS